MSFGIRRAINRPVEHKSNFDMRHVPGIMLRHIHAAHGLDVVQYELARVACQDQALKAHTLFIGSMIRSHQRPRKRLWGFPTSSKNRPLLADSGRAVYPKMLILA